MKAIILSLLVLVSGTTINKITFNKLKSLKQDLQIADQINEVLYLPNGRALDLISLGYKNVLANIIWFNTLNYFGKHYRKDQQYPWLEHMCNLIVNLDPRSRSAYEFCSLVLSWESASPEAALKIINKAIAHEPTFWRYYYLKGMTHVLFTKNEHQAKLAFEQGAKQKNAPGVMAWMAARKMIRNDNLEDAASFLEEMIKQSPDITQRDILMDQYMGVKHKLNIEKINSLIENFKITNKRMPNNISELNLNSNQDPYGGQYFIDAEGKVGSTSHKNTKNIFKGKKDE